MTKSFDEINEKIKNGKAVILTAEEIIYMVEEKGIKETAKTVDVVTTGTFGPMCSSGVFLNFGQSDPPIKMSKVWLNDVPAYGGLASVDAYLGATELRENVETMYGGAHVIEELIDGKTIKLRGIGTLTDCKPKQNVEIYFDKSTINECILFNPRNAYQNYVAATNSTNKVIYTYMGKLLPNFQNVTYCNAGQLSPLLNDPKLRTIGIGTRIFLGGTVGYVSWNGTQFNSLKPKADNGIPFTPGRTLSVIGDLKQMSTDYIRAFRIEKYGVSMCVGIGIPIPILDEEMVEYVSIRDRDIQTSLVDYGIESRNRPTIRLVNYEELKSGEIEIGGKKVPTSSISSMYKARKIAETLKQWIYRKNFLLQSPIEMLPMDSSCLTMPEK